MLLIRGIWYIIFKMSERLFSFGRKSFLIYFFLLIALFGALFSHSRVTFAITPEEQAKVDACGYDLVAELKGGKKSDNVGNYGKPKESMETAPEDVIDPEDIPADLGEEPKVESEDDMPF